MKPLLAEACHNTFLLLDQLHYRAVDQATLKHTHQLLLAEQRDDALLLVNGKSEGSILTAQMIVLGLDGELGEFCGNGSRACAAYLFDQYPQFRSFYLTTAWGKHRLERYGDLYSIELPHPRFEPNPKFLSDPLFLEKQGYHYIEMIEPHLLVEGELSDDELFELGRALNAQKNIFPLGINVNAWHFNGQLFVKTYERGVQRLTKSCGTGSVSCAAYLMKRGALTVITPGGELQIALHDEGITLKGPASVSYRHKRGKLA